MPVVISDEMVQKTGLSERTLLVEIACRLFEAGRLFLPDAARMVGLTRSEMEAELIVRGIAIFRPTIEEVQRDLETLKRLDD